MRRLGCDLKWVNSPSLEMLHPGVGVLRGMAALDRDWTRCLCDVSGLDLGWFLSQGGKGASCISLSSLTTT